MLTAADGSRYMVYLPKTWAAKSAAVHHPVLLFLHGRGGVKSEANIRGQSLTKMLLESDPQLFGPWSDRDGFPFIVLIPMAGQPDWQTQFPSLLSLVAMAHNELHGDPARTYLTGQSMGGNGAWHLAASATPGVFAALAPVCGYLEIAPAPKKKKKKKGAAPEPQPPQLPIPEPNAEVLASLINSSIPIWAFHAAYADFLACCSLKNSDDHGIYPALCCVFH